MDTSLKSTSRFVFVSNIKDPLAEDLNPFPRKMDAFLLSETYSTAKTLDFTANAKSSGSLIVSDNGNFSRMRSIASTFEKNGKDLCAQARREARRGIVKKATIAKRNALVRRIRKAVVAETKQLDISKIVDRQLMCDPDYLIGMEDLTIPVLQLCSCLDPCFAPRPSSVKRFQKDTQTSFRRVRDGVFGHTKELRRKRKFLVYHAYDYDSAVQVAKVNKTVKADGIAIGLGAALASVQFIPKLRLGKKNYQFEAPLPESYLLSIALTLGATSEGGRKLPVHILGLGSPILIVLLGALLQRSSAVSIDSTATYKDADDGTLYGSRSAYLKMDMYKVAAYALIDNEPYDSSSPWFGWFNEQHPADWPGLRKKLRVKSTDDVDDVVVKLKRHPKWIETYIPFFTPMRSGADDFIKKVRLARAGANFWVVKTICSEIRKRKKEPARLHNWVENEVKRYVLAASPKWALAVKAGFQIIREQAR